MRWPILILLLLSAFAGTSQTNPFASVNSIYDEQNPVLSPDGKTLYITRANHPQNVGGLKDPGDIWISIRTETGWSAPVHAGNVLNNRSYNAVAGFDKTGTEMYLLSHYSKTQGTPTTQGIAVSRQTATGWSTPQNLTIPYFLNRSTFMSGQFHSDLSVLVFAAEAYNTVGAEDLYVSFQVEGRWTEPLNLGNQVNTPFQEMSPRLNADGTRLFFASNGRRGSGSFDIYVSDRLDDTWKNWSIPVNLGAQVNSEGRELFFQTYEKHKLSLFNSTRNSDGYGDIKWITDSVTTPLALAVDTVVKIIPVKRDSVVSDKRVKISGRVTNSKSGIGIAARLNFKSDSVYTAQSTDRGDYSVWVPSTKVYSIEVESKGFVNLAEKLDIHTFEMQALEMNFKLQPIEVGALVSLKSVLFEIGTTRLLDESYDELNVVVDFLQANPKVEIELEGHTDNRGDRVKNQLLSQQRVDTIKTYLVSKGISAKRIRGKGYGGTRPIATNDSEEARRLNRRVEFRIVKN